MGLGQSSEERVGGEDEVDYKYEQLKVCKCHIILWLVVFSMYDEQYYNSTLVTDRIV